MKKVLSMYEKTSEIQVKGQSQLKRLSESIDFNQHQI